MTAEVRLVDADELRRRIEANRSAWDAWSYRNALYLLDSLSTVLSVPALRDALARDAQVREIVQSMRTATVQGDVWAVVGRLAALYPESEVASMLRDGEGFDDSDIVPGSEFDGPVVL